jgi:hypothetical protein
MIFASPIIVPRLSLIMGLMIIVIGECRCGRSSGSLTVFAFEIIYPFCRLSSSESSGVPAGWPFTSVRKVLWLTYR